MSNILTAIGHLDTIKISLEYCLSTELKTRKGKNIQSALKRDLVLLKSSMTMLKKISETNKSNNNAELIKFLEKKIWELKKQELNNGKKC